MDVRCEKCGTEYELDEARLKPGGVTVKCTNCGHMFKIRKRAPTNVGAAIPGRARAGSSRPVRATTDDTARGTAVPTRPPTVDSGRVRADSGRARAPDSGRMFRSGTEDGGGERLWIIRLDNGEQQTCRELATLQQWIVSGAVSRDSMISRSGKTWKRLGDIAELASFFIVADEARLQRTSRDSGRVTAPMPAPADDPRRTQLGVAAAPGPVERPPRPAPAPDRDATQAAAPRALADAARPAKEPSLSSTATGVPPAPAPATLRPLPAAPPVPAVPAAPAVLPSVPPGARAPAGNPTVPATPLSRAATPPPVPAPPPPQPPRPPAPPADRATGAWASEGIKPVADRSTGQWASEEVVGFGGHGHDDGGPEGPTAGRLTALGDEPAFGGRIGGVATDDVAFAGHGARPSAAPERSIFDEDSEDVVMPARGGAGKWIALASLVVIGGAATAIYLGVLRNKGGGDAGSGSGTASDGSGQVVAVAQDAREAAPPPDAGAPPPVEDPIAAARTELESGVAARLAAAGRKLAAEESKPGAIALEAQLAAAQAQGLEDQAALATDRHAASSLHRDAQKQALTAVGLAQRALKLDAGDPAAKIAMADVLRLQGRPARSVRRYLDAALVAKDRDAKLVDALLLARDGKAADAKTELEALDAGPVPMEQSGDVRAHFRLAMLAFAGGDAATARTLAQEVLAVVPEHDGAKALLDRVKEPVAMTDPLPHEEHGGSGAGHDSGTGGGHGSGHDSGGPSTSPGTGGADGGYDAALARANKLAVDGDCGKAMADYQKALSIKPTSVEALTGAGFCYIDAKQFASAHSSFRTALSISPRYERALWGIAEAYQQQGLPDRAIDAYKHYLEAYPDSAAAKKQLERLGAPAPGGGGGSAAPGGGGGSAAPGGEGAGGGSAPGGGAGSGSAPGGVTTTPGGGTTTPSGGTTTPSGGTTAPAGGADTNAGAGSTSPGTGSGSGSDSPGGN